MAARLRSIEEIESFCCGKTFDEFQGDRGLQLIVERELEIIGEALARLGRVQSSVDPGGHPLLHGLCQAYVGPQ